MFLMHNYTVAYKEGTKDVVAIVAASGLVINDENGMLLLYKHDVNKNEQLIAAFTDWSSVRVI